MYYYSSQLDTLSLANQNVAVIMVGIKPVTFVSLMWMVEWLGYCNIQHKFHEVHTPIWSILNNPSIITDPDTPMYHYPSQPDTCSRTVYGQVTPRSFHPDRELNSKPQSHAGCDSHAPTNRLSNCMVERVGYCSIQYDFSR